MTPIGPRTSARFRACLAAALLGGCVVGAAAESPAVGRSWPVYGGDAAGTKYSALDAINRANVSRLKPAWVYRCDDMRARPASTIECNPIVVDGVMYITTPGLNVVALEAATGQERWKFDPWAGKPGSGVNRGVTYWSDGVDRRIFFVAGTFLFALDAANGQPAKGFGTEGKIDLRTGLARLSGFVSTFRDDSPLRG